MINEIGSTNFNKEVIEESIPVVVDFWATWCGACKMLEPVLEEVSNELHGKAKFLKISVDEAPDIARKFRVTSIPTVIIFKNGSVVQNIVGFTPKDEIIKILQAHID